MNLINCDLTAQDVVNILSCDDPKVTDEYGIISMEHEVNEMSVVV